jgi:chromate transporter
MLRGEGSGGRGYPALEAAQPAHEAPPAWLLLRVWLGLGVQSFGGGTATQLLIYRAFVERRSWLTPEEFTSNWAIVQATPGINLLALTILIGWKLRGGLGVALSLLGLLLPSVSITVLMTALYAGVRDEPLVRAALRGIVPATVGLGLVMSYRLVRPILAASRREGRTSLLISVALLAGSAAAVAFAGAPVVLVLCAAGAAAALAGWRGPMSERRGR